ncbi:MAG: peptide chain release factor 1 [Planctomycetota bacterium]
MNDVPDVPQAMLRKLGELRDRHAELTETMNSPDLFNDPGRARSVLKEHAALKTMVETFADYTKTVEALDEAKELIAGDDPELAELAKEELPTHEHRLGELVVELRELFATSDKDAESDVIVEISAGVGGDEASLFAGDLFKMYEGLSATHGWKVEVLDHAEGNSGGFKRVSFTVEGDAVYRRLRFESGGHRVQRVPKTESQGRIHTSMVTVVVLPQVEEVDIEIDKNEVRVDKFCASGPGGQHVNKTESAIRLTHEPTGIVVQCQDEKSQHKNLDRAWKVLRARVADHFKELAEKERGEQRKTLRGRGMRNERIRTYNFPQDRCTDHRIGHSIHGLDQILQGDVDSLIDKLIEHDKEEALKAL